MTPVEERIDHAKRAATEFAEYDSIYSLGGTMYGKRGVEEFVLGYEFASELKAWLSVIALSKVYLALLTEHSAREERLVAALSRIQHGDKMDGFRATNLSGPQCRQIARDALEREGL